MLMAVISAPLDWVESVSDLRLPPKADRRLQDLMDRNTEGQLTEAESADLEALVELSEKLSLVRSEALHLLGVHAAIGLGHKDGGRTQVGEDIHRHAAERQHGAQRDGDDGYQDGNRTAHCGKNQPHNPVFPLLCHFAESSK
jgi:hypothetical protein